MPPKVTQTSTSAIKIGDISKGLIVLTRNNFISWKNEFERVKYLRNWADHGILDCDTKWDGIEEKDEEARNLRKECYFLLTRSMPEGSDYYHLLTGLKIGDANAIWRRITGIFQAKDNGSISTKRKEFHTLSMANTRLNVTKFASKVLETASLLLKYA